jgi:uncharacterized membrane protein
MPAPRISVTQDFSKPVDRIFDFLSEHENLSNIFPGKVSRVRDGTDGTRNGVGSVRKIAAGPGPKLIEENTVVIPNERIEYKLTGGVPVKHHHGTMQFSSLPDGGSRLKYDIELELPIPGAAPVVAAVLKQTIVRGLRRVEKLA